MILGVNMMKRDSVRFWQEIEGPVTFRRDYPGYYEELTLEELLKRTSFQAYENMPLFMKMGFAIGMFEKNTIFSVR